MDGHGDKIVGRLAGKHSDLFCAVAQCHNRGDIFYALFLQLSDLFRQIVSCAALELIDQSIAIGAVSSGEMADGKA